MMSMPMSMTAAEICQAFFSDFHRSKGKRQTSQSTSDIHHLHTSTLPPAYQRLLLGSLID